VVRVEFHNTDNGEINGMLLLDGLVAGPGTQSEFISPKLYVKRYTYVVNGGLADVANGGLL
jgi:hypothetical protein